MSPRQSATSLLGWGFLTLQGGIDRVNCAFVPGLLELLRYGRIFFPQMKPYPPRVRRDLDVIPSCNFRHALAS